MQHGELELVIDAKATLGEGPAWDNVCQCLYWVDIFERQVHVYAPESLCQRTICLNEYVSSVVPSEPGQVIVTLQHGFYRLNLETGAVSTLAIAEDSRDDIRFNDGKCDAAGRFWAGTMSTRDERYQGILYCLDSNLNLIEMIRGVSTSNGLAWSPDSRTMYYIDTPTGEIMAYDYCLETGTIENPRVAVRIPVETGLPDGMTTDSEGCLWIAHWGGGRASRWNPHSGDLLDEVHVPASLVTSCVFGGDDLTDLYITTARTGLDDAQLAEQPNAGGLFRVATTVGGLLTYRFQGSSRL